MGRIELGYQVDDINKKLVNLGYKEPYGTVLNNDVFDFQPQKVFKKRPHIIVGNPPFKDTRSTGGASEQKAAY